ncbi:MAG: 50S ribosomal protein L1 [Patescibacteria group bacterium]
MGQTKTKVIQDLQEQPGTNEAAPAKVEEEKKKVQRVRPPRVRGKRFIEARSQVDRRNRYDLDEAIELAKKTSWTKFDGTIEFHIATLSKKGQDALRGTLTLPAGTPKLPKVAIASDSLIEEIAKGKLEFDVLLAEAAMMPKLAKVAKVLGPKGLMPNPKAGTIVEDAKKAAEEFTKGKIEYRADSLGNIHVAVGKVSWDAAKIKANVEALLKVLPRTRLAGAVLSSTMGPGVKLALT